MASFDKLSCPVCNNPLVLDEKSLKCTKGHNFDVSAKGYVNLLMSNDKNSRDPGDNKEMVLARRRFLEKGYYSTLSGALADLVVRIAGTEAPHGLHILDAGCGEGYYTGSILHALNHHNSEADITGMDISKNAVAAASSRHKDILFCVASLFKLPLADKSQNIIINAFSPSCDNEFARVLKKEGTLLCVIPGRDHLYDLKQILYSNPTYNDEKEPVLPSFIIREKIHIKDEINISENDDIMDLLSMTPYFWRTPEEGVKKLRETKSLSTAVDFIILILKPL